jgi:hypothetical protein
MNIPLVKSIYPSQKAKASTSKLQAAQGGVRHPTVLRPLLSINFPPKDHKNPIPVRQFLP